MVLFYKYNAIRPPNVAQSVTAALLMSPYHERVNNVCLSCSSDNEKLETFCGSPPYAAPELFLDQRYVGRPVDVWSLGVLLFFMTTASMPFLADNMAGFRRSILAGHVDVPAWISQPLKSLIGKYTHTHIRRYVQGLQRTKPAIFQIESIALKTIVRYTKPRLIRCR